MGHDSSQMHFPWALTLLFAITEFVYAGWDFFSPHFNLFSTPNIQTQ